MKSCFVRVSVLFLLIFSLCFCGCTFEFKWVDDVEKEKTPVCDHIFGDWVSTATCTEAGERTRTCTKCGATESEAAPALGHDLQDIPAQAPTCEEDGWEAYHGCTRCDLGREPDNVIPALGHLTESHAGQEPTCTEAGWSPYETCQREGCDYTTYAELPPTGHTFTDGVCTACGVREETVYHSDFGYTALGALENGAALQAFYDAIDESQSAFFTSEDDVSASGDGGGTYYMVGEIPLGSLSSDEATAVWSVYRMDHPLYFWIAPQVLHSETKLMLLTDAKYASGATRAAMRETVLNGLSTLITGAPAGATAYEYALYFHDAILRQTDYAYEADGVTPKDTLDAHALSGFFLGEDVVCEGYSKVYQACLNACGVENILVTGQAGGGGHAWNLVRLEGGGWYWCDLTWDDEPELTEGYRYTYFLVTDGQTLGGSLDGDLVASASTFLSTHTPASSETLGTSYLYPLPARASIPYAGEGAFLLRATFSVSDGAGNTLTFTRTGAQRVQLISLDGTGDVTLPETVTYGGQTYTVTGIGKQSAEGVFTRGEIGGTHDGVTSLTLPKTLETVWCEALGMKGLTAIEVAAGSLYFSSADGVLFNADMTALVQYPAAREGTAYVIPDTVIAVASGAFWGKSALALETLTLGKSVRYFGVVERGYGYPVSGEDLTFDPADNEFGYTAAKNYGLTQWLSIEVSTENPNFKKEDGCLTSRDGKVFYRADPTVTALTLSAEVETVCDYAFFGCSSLTEIAFSGTQEAFEAAIAASGYWNQGGKVASVTCSDGTITVQN